MAAVDGEPLSPPALEFLEDALAASFNSAATVSSTTRTARRQAELMLEMIERDGVDATRALYGSAGDDVVGVYLLNRDTSDRSILVSRMSERVTHWVNTLGPGRTQFMHIEPAPNHTFDVAPSSLANGPAFVQYLQGHPEVARFFPPGGAEKAFHVEVAGAVSTIAGGWTGTCAWPGSLTETVSLTISRSNGVFDGRYVAHTNGASSPLRAISIDRKAKNIAFAIFGTAYVGTLNINNTQLSVTSNDRYLKGVRIVCSR